MNNTSDVDVFNLIDYCFEDESHEELIALEMKLETVYRDKRGGRWGGKV